jgi:PAP2 superfamily protein
VQHDDPKNSLEIGASLICGAAAVFAGYLLIVGQVGIDVSSLGAPLLLLAFLVGAHIVYRWWRPEPVISDICGALAVITLSAAAAGIISLAGLRLGAPLIDGNLAAYDSALLFDTRSIVVAVANATAFAGLLGLAYVSSFPILFASVVLLGWTRHVRPLWQLAFVFAFTAVGCATLSVFLPAAGAFSHFAFPAEVLGGLPSGAGVYHLPKLEYYRHAVAPTISMSSLQGVVTFPSFHCCLALMTAFAYVEHRWLFLFSVLWNGLVILSTIPIGGHYIVDLPAGAALWGVAYVLATALWRGTGETTLSLQSSQTASSSGT